MAAMSLGALALVLLGAVTPTVVTVVDEAGRPVPGVRVQAWTNQMAWESAFPEGFYYGEPMTARTDARGVCTLSTPEEPLTLLVTHPGYAPTETRGSIAAGTPIRIFLTRGQSVHGTVFDGVTGWRVEGAEVSAISGIAAGHSTVATTTDECGEYHLPPLEPGTFDLRVHAPGYAPALQEVQIGREPAWVPDLLITPRPPLTVSVVDPAGVRVPGAAVHVGCRDSKGLPILMTGPSGTVVVDGSPACPILEAAAYHPGFSELTPALRRPTFDGQGFHLQLQLPPAAILAGSIESEGGDPVAHATIMAYGQRQTRAATSALDGSFVVPGLSPGDYDLAVSAPNHLDAHATLTLPIEGLADVEVVLPEGARVLGRVTDEGNRPVPGAEVVVGTTAPSVGQDPAEEESTFTVNRWGASRSTSSDADGRFEVGGLTDGPISVRVSHDGYVTAEQTHPAGTRSVDVVLQRGAQVAGYVRSAARPSEPMLGVVNVIWVPGRSDPSRASALIAYTRPDGFFELSGIPAGTWVVSAGAVDHARLELPPLTLTDGERRDDLLLELTAGGSVSGAVIDRQGNPLPDVLVSCFGCASLYDVIADTTGPEGTFRLEGLSGPTVSLRFSQRSRAPRQISGIRVEPGRDTSLPPTVLSARSGLRGRIVFRGSPLSGATVYSHTHSAVSDVAGRFQWDDLPGGVLQLTVRAMAGGAHREKTFEVDLAESGWVDRDFEMGTGVRLTGTVLRQDGTPLSSGTVTAQSQQAVMGPDGSFEVASVSPGVVQLRVDAGEIHHIEELTVPATPVHHVRVAIPDGVITGRLVDASTQQPVRGFVHAGPSSGAATEESGAFRLSNLTAGTHELTAQAPSYETRRFFVRLAAGETKAGVLLQIEAAESGELRGRVVSADGNPVFLAIVAMSPGFYQAASARTDSAGEFLITDFTAGRYDVVAYAAGWGPAIRPGVDLGPGDNVELRLPPSANVEVEVQRGGRPVVGARVQLIADGPTAFVEEQLESRFQTFSDGEGVARLIGLPEGLFRVRVLSAYGVAEAAITPTAGRTIQVRLDL